MSSLRLIETEQLLEDLCEFYFAFQFPAKLILSQMASVGYLSAIITRSFFSYIS
jgi:hypothetical protein